jgi:methyltransferase (TIGR00027 family)
MDQGKASRTAIRAAVFRAIHQLIDDEPKIVTDPVAVRLTEASAPGAIDEGMKTFSPPARPDSRALFVLRSRFAEDELAVAATQSVGQYIILGAGLDTFAYRQPSYAGALNIFEVDHPATQAWKRESLAVADVSPPTNLRWVPVDFERQTLPEQLAAAGFDGARPAFFSWLGVLQYLTLPAIDDTLRFVARLPSPSTIVLTFALADDALSDDARRGKHQTMQMTAALGEPWVTFFRPDELRARLHGLGFARVSHLSAQEANVRYFAGRRDGMQTLPYIDFICATV